MVSVILDEKKLDALADLIVKRIQDKLLKAIFGELIEILHDIFKAINKLAEAQRRTEERLNELAKRVDELAEAQRRTEERLNELAKRVDELAKRVDELAEAQRRTEERLNDLIKVVSRLTGEVARIDGELIELKVVQALSSFLGRYGMVAYPSTEIKDVDAIVETDGFITLIEICKRCDEYDIEQLLRGARKFESTWGIKPDLLVVFSYTGEISENARMLAKEHGIIIENGFRRLALKILEKFKEKNRK